MIKSVKITVSTLCKIHRKIPKDSTFYQYYEAKMALDAKDLKDLKGFSGKFASHIKVTQNMMKKF